MNAACMSGISRVLGDSHHQALARRIAMGAWVEAPSTGLWFASYVGAKETMLRGAGVEVDDTGEDQFDALQLGVVTAAGAASGMVQSVSAQMLEQAWERQLVVPTVQGLIRAVPLSVLTFLAFEYG
eukprot:TRINITY_DN60847_c0_g1_i1.p1 TRINITY_DN60847_c0_g1~~TRINITY_DN60847_c0_g1_i1.p1  ORF type:complete len:126 (+),score=17.06 TRINITY_DN60847_c0_g1_i1:71-448(+)